MSRGKEKLNLPSRHLRIFFGATFMLTLGYFTKFPSRYRHREDSLKNVTFIDISKEVEEDGIIIRSNTGKYAQEIKIFDTAIRLKSPCK